MKGTIAKIFFGMFAGFVFTMILLSTEENTGFYKYGYDSGYKQGQIDAFKLNIHWRIAMNEDLECVWTYFEEPKDSFTENLF